MGILDITPDQELLGIKDILNIQNISYVSEIFFKRFNFYKIFDTQDIAIIQQSISKVVVDGKINYSATDKIEQIFKERITPHIRKICWKKHPFKTIMVGSTFRPIKEGLQMVIYLCNPLDKHWLRSQYFRCECLISK